jgi:TRAP-type C4-dicarboxylate transport system substrate-binding protein
MVNDHNPPQSTVAAAWDIWAQWVEEQSAGRLKVTVIHGGALLTGDEAYRGTQSGVCDVAHYVVDREDGFLLNLIMALPFLGWSEQHVEGKYMTLLDEFPEMSAEWEGVKIIGMMMMPPTHLHNIVKEVKTPADLAGMKIMGAEAMTVEAVGAAGATAVEIGIMDMTPSLQTGLIEGVINHFPVCGIFGALELLKYHTVFGGGGINMTPMFAIMNTAKFNSLPADLQKILIDSGQMWTDTQAELDVQSMEQALAMCEGHTFTNLTPEQIKVWYDLVKAPIHDKWIAECEAAGLPGQEVYDRALELVTK